MADDTLRWKLFQFSLLGKAKKWYNHHVGSSQGDWEVLRGNFCLKFFLSRKSLNYASKSHDLSK